jgi:hypothetical protein
MSEREKMWWTLSDVVDWVRRTDSPGTIGQIRVVLEDRCAADRIRTRGRRLDYRPDRPMLISHLHPDFVQFAEEYGKPRPSFDAISAAEWKDLTFFARLPPGMGEPYHVALTLALDQLASPVELRSVSKRRLAWKDVEFWRDDVIGEWPQASDVATKNEAEYQPRSNAAGDATDARLVLRSSTKGSAPLSVQDLRQWYDGRIAQLKQRGETSSGEDDWTAAKQQFAGRVTRARMREVREELAPASWKKQGRRSPRIAK